MDDQKQQIIEKLQAANNILVTVSANPSVDQLSACIGLTLLLNKLNKHATAVFSGKVPTTIGFLKPEDTIEKNTDSLRDFIISLDKSKADKLRYKVEDEVVKIFITPYKSSINEKDLVFSQGDFNVDVVMAIGVHQQQDLDNAITAHGRILHDAVVICVNNTPNANLGSINWQNLSASGVSELVSTLATGLGDDLLDSQIATALLTGIVSETDHFSNQKTTPATMTVSAALLAAGANQQLVSAQLGKPEAPPAAAESPTAAPAKKQPNDQLKISHNKSEKTSTKKSDDTAKEDTSEEKTEGAVDPESIDALLLEAEAELAKANSVKHSGAAAAPESVKHEKVIEPPEAPTEEPAPEAAKSEVEAQPAPPVESAPEPAPAPAPSTPLPSPAPVAVPPPSTPSTPQADKTETLTALEATVNSPHATEPTPDPEAIVDDARKAVEDALKSSPDEELSEAFNAVPVNLDLGHDAPAQPASAPLGQPEPYAAPAMQPGPGTPPPAPAGLPDYLQTPSVAPTVVSPSPAMFMSGQPAPGPLDTQLPTSTDMSSNLVVPPPQVIPPTTPTMPPAGPPPPPVPPPMPPR